MKREPPSIAAILERFENPRKSGSGWIVRCPAHNDRKNSLSLSKGSNGKLLLKCQAGCDTESVISAVGLRWRDLFGMNDADPVVHRYTYVDEQAKPLFRVCRAASKKFFQERHAHGAFIRGMAGARRVLYRLPQVLKAKSVVLVEGEKDVESLEKVGLTATTNPGGAGKWSETYTAALQGKRVAIIPDNDKPGREHARKVAVSILPGAESVKIVKLPGVPDKGDVSDYLKKHSKDDLLKLIKAATPFTDENSLLAAADPGEPLGNAASEAATKKPQKSQADILIEIVMQSGAELFHTSIAEPFISFSIADHVEVWPVRSKPARRWMTEQFYRTTGKAPNGEAMQAALGVVEALATFTAKQQEVHLRSAWHDRALYYDLADEAWRVVQIDVTGWQIVDKSPVAFRRYSHTAAQAEPKPDGKVESIWSFLNIKQPRDRRLVEAWLVSAFIPNIPRPVLVAHGDQGSAKSTACKMLLSLVDPSATPCLRTRDATELIQALAHRFAALFDNVSTLPDWLSDLLCCAVTGDGFSKRMLFTDDDDVIYTYRRALLFNGINVAISKPDLLDRTLLIQLEQISDDGRREEADLWQQFNTERPRILGAIFTRLSDAIRNYDAMKPSRLPRMADFAALGDCLQWQQRPIP